MTIKLKGNYETRQVWLNGEVLSPEPSLKIRNHSPDGFAWGYGGSGPSQLSLAILLRIFGEKIARENYQDFKFKEIAILPQTDFEKEITINF